MLLGTFLSAVQRRAKQRRGSAGRLSAVLDTVATAKPGLVANGSMVLHGENNAASTCDHEHECSSSDRWPVALNASNNLIHRVMYKLLSELR
jgi:hypothetical protein